MHEAEGVLIGRTINVDHAEWNHQHKRNIIVKTSTMNFSANSERSRPLRAIAAVIASLLATCCPQPQKYPPQPEWTAVPTWAEHSAKAGTHTGSDIDGIWHFYPIGPGGSAIYSIVSKGRDRLVGSVCTLNDAAFVAKDQGSQFVLHPSHAVEAEFRKELEKTAAALGWTGIAQMNNAKDHHLRLEFPVAILERLVGRPAVERLLAMDGKFLRPPFKEWATVERVKKQGPAGEYETVRVDAIRVMSDLKCIGPEPTFQRANYGAYSSHARDTGERMTVEQAYKDSADGLLYGGWIGEQRPPIENEVPNGTYCVANQSEATCDDEKKRPGSRFLRCNNKKATIEGTQRLGERVIFASGDAAPGVLVQSRTLADVLQRVKVSRKPMTIYLRGLCSGSVKAENVDVSSPTEIYHQLTQAAAGCALQGSVARVVASDDRSRVDFDFKLRVTGSYAGFSADVEANVVRNSNKTVYRTLYQEVFVTAHPTELPINPMDIFTNPTEQVRVDEFSGDNPPVFINSVGYGRQLYLVIAIDKTLETVKAKIEAAYNKTQACAKSQADCDAIKENCRWAVSNYCAGDPKSELCHLATDECENKVDQCLKTASGCTQSSSATSIEVKSMLDVAVENESVEVNAVSIGGDGAGELIGGTLDRGKHIDAIKKWLSTPPTNFAQLRPISVSGVWLEPELAALYRTNVVGDRHDCVWENGPDLPPPPPDYTIEFKNIDDEVFVWSGQTATDTRAAIIHHSLGSFDDSLSEAIGTFDEPRDITIKLLNSGCVDSGGIIRILKNGKEVWSHNENMDWRHCSWIYRETLRLHPDGTVESRSYEPCVNDPDARCKQ